MTAAMASHSARSGIDSMAKHQQKQRRGGVPENKQQ